MSSPIHLVAGNEEEKDDPCVLLSRSYIIVLLLAPQITRDKEEKGRIQDQLKQKKAELSEVISRIEAQQKVRGGGCPLPHHSLLS